MQNEDKIKSTIDVILAQKLNHAYMTCSYLPDIHELSKAVFAAIAPHLEAGEPDWSDAPEWARWRTVDKDGTVNFWEHKPIQSDLGCWIQSDSRTQYLEKPYTHDGWETSIQQRPQ